MTVPPGWSPDPRSSPFLDTLGPALVRSEADRTVSLGLVVERRHLNGRGTLHGGVVTALADVALGRSCALLSDPPEGLVTVGLDVQFLAAARAGDLVELRTSARHSTRGTVVAQGTATVDGTVIAVLTGVFRRPPTAS